MAASCHFLEDAFASLEKKLAGLGKAQAAAAGSELLLNRRSDRGT
jgi:hypothetical protein